MQETGLLGDDFRPVGFDDWQQAALKAERNKRAYQSRVSRDSVGSKSVVSRQSAVVSTSETETDTDTDKNHDMSSSPPANIDDPLEIQTTQVIEHFKSATGKQRVSVKSRANRKHVKARLKDGAAPEDLMAIADLKTAQVRAGQFQDQFLRIETLYNETKCQSYLAELDAIRAGPQATERTRQAVDALKDYYQGRNHDGQGSGSINALGGCDGGEVGQREAERILGPAVGDSGGLFGGGGAEPGED